MKKILLLCIMIACYCLTYAQQISFTSNPPVVNSSAPSVLITAVGENRDLAIDMDVAPYIKSVTIESPNNQNYASNIAYSDQTIASKYNPSTNGASSMKATINNSASVAIKLTITYGVTFINVNSASFTTGDVKYTVTVNPATVVTPPVPPPVKNKIYARLMLKKIVQNANDIDPTTGIFDLSVYFYKNETVTDPVSVNNLKISYHNINETTSTSPSTPPHRSGGSGDTGQGAGDYVVHEVIVNGTQFSLGQVNVPSGPRRTGPPPVSPTPAQLGYVLDPIGGYIIYY